MCGYLAQCGLIVIEFWDSWWHNKCSWPKQSYGPAWKASNASFCQRHGEFSTFFGYRSLKLVTSASKLVGLDLIPRNFLRKVLTNGANFQEFSKKLSSVTGISRLLDHFFSYRPWSGKMALFRRCSAEGLPQKSILGQKCGTRKLG